jgi:hypothetical protein
MKKLTFLAIIAMAFAFVGCDQNNPDNYADYPQLIVGKWFNFTPTASVFMNFGADGKYIQQGYDVDLGWIEYHGTYRIDGNVMNKTIENEDGTHQNSAPATIQVTNEKFIVKIEDPNLGDKENYRVKESFDIKGNYSYLNSAVKVESAEGKTALQLPEGVLFQGQNSIPVEAMHGDRIVDVMKKFFADATFAADGKLNHTLDGEAKTKNYTLDGNNLTFNLYEGSETYKVNATSFPDEDGDRLFIIIPKQAAWLGGMVDLVEKEQAGLKLTEAQIAELEKEFMATFETFTVILSLSKK